MKADLKISRAVTKLAFSHPFYGSMIMSVGHEESEQIPTMATNGKRIFWNETFTDKLTEDQTRTILCHEVLHIVFQHCQNWPGFPDQKLQNIAMDHCINNTLFDEGFDFPEGVVRDPIFQNWNWQRVYRVLEDCVNKEQDKQDGNEPDYESGPAGDEGLSQEKQEELGQKTSQMIEDPDIMDIIDRSDLSEEEKDDLKRKIIQAAEAQKSSGIGSLPGGVDDIIKEIRASKVDWREYLTETMQKRWPMDYTMRRPNKKFLNSAGIYMPTMDGTVVGKIGVGLDTSGSVSHAEKMEYLAELNAIFQEFQPEQIYVMYADCEVANVEIYEQGEEIDTLNARGGGGTSFVPIFEFVEDNDVELDMMLVFSDMEVYDDCFPKEEPDYPTLFISTRDYYDVPFGECITTKGVNE